MKRSLIRGLSCIAALLLMVFCCATVLGNEYEGSINSFLNIQTGGVSSLSKDAYVYKTAYTEDGIPSDEGMEKLIEAEDAFNKEAMEESAVLVYNNGALPFTSETKNVTLFGRSVVDSVYKGGGAGASIDENRVIDLPDAMRDAGFSVNETLLSAYEQDPTRRQNGSEASIGEVDISFYNNSLQETFSAYGDAAIVLLSRFGGEGNDLARVDVDGISQLALHPQEADLLKMIKSYKDRGVFKKVVVLLNSAYAMELEWLYDAQYGVDACLWMGNPGLTGFSGIPGLLNGEVNPSGHFVDTFAADSLSAPAVRNMGDTPFSNLNKTYAVYAESIYIGYKYYETRYEDLILDRYNADSSAGAYASSGGWDYAAEVAFPFGFGLSYTQFSQTLDSVVWNDDGTITVRVTVTNTGDVAGKDAVQVYAQVPYTGYDRENLVEKSAIQLLDFGKTDLLAPGASETVEIVADQYLLASWDKNAQGGEGSYILEDGDYYIAIGDDAHDALNNILAAKGASGMYDERGAAVAGNAANAAKEVMTEFDDDTYKTSPYLGGTVENRFSEGRYATDYNAFFPGEVTYLTRQNWNTYPATVEGLQISEEMQKTKNGDFYDELKSAVGEPEEYTLETDAGLSFIDMYGAEWEDQEKWDLFLSQLSVAELSTIVSDAWGQKAIKKIAKPANYQCDGPDGGSIKYKYGEQGNNTLYVNEGTMACSWNKDILRRRGEFLAEDAFYNNTNCTMAPGVDIHRTPFSGRNHEYYSEDGTLSYLMGAIQCKAMQDKGTVAMLKHLCGNDQETNRSGLSEFMTEQALREVILKGFEGCMMKGGAMSAMAGFNALGVCDVARNYALLTGVIRDEWGWRGFINTDAGDFAETVEVCIVSGTDEFCLDSTIFRTVAQKVNAGDKYLLDALMDTNKRFYYTYLRSNLVNGITQETVVQDTDPWWKGALIAFDIAFGILAAAGCGLYLFMVCTGKTSLHLGRREKTHE